MRAIGLILLTVFMPMEVGARQGPPPGAAPPPRVTDRARPDFGYVPWTGTDVTVVVVFSVDCADCVASIPFYRRVRQRIGDDTDRRRMVVMTQDGIWPAIRKIEAHPEGFKPGRVVSYPRDDRFALKAMPTVLLFGAGRARVGEWRGRLDANGERELMDAIDGLVGREKKEGAHE